MGYETKLIIGKSGHQLNDGIWFNDMAEINMCKLGNASHVYDLDQTNKSSKEHWYFYGSDGDTQIKEDHYGHKFKPVPIKEVISALEKDDYQDYRRAQWALALLNAMKDDSEELEVIIYGY